MKTRFDAAGFLWDDTGKPRPERLGWMPPIPDTGWRPPAGFPNLSAAKALAVDVETYDPELTEAGPGWARGPVGHIVGFSVAVPNGPGWYFPLRHTVEPQDNRDPATCLRWLGHQLNDNRPKVGANILYDLGWLRQEGVPFQGPFYDVQYAEALLNSEEPDVSLEALSWKYLGHGKQTDLLKEWCQNYYRTSDSKWRKDIYRAPPRLVGHYGEGDARQPLEILTQQWPLLQQRGVLDIFKLECRLIPMLLAMRFKGAPVDVNYAEELSDNFAHQQGAVEEEIKDIVGKYINPNSADDLAGAFDALGIRYYHTANGAPSFTDEFLEGLDHPIAEPIRFHRKLGKIRGTFLKGYIIDKSVNGRIHCSFHPLKGDGKGARSGRLSSSDPNLQNIPTRAKDGDRWEEHAKAIRKAFVARGRRWRSWDYSQIEYRLFAHHAVGPGADDIRALYRSNPKTDYHKATGKMIIDMTGQDIPRPYIKNINFGLLYGASKKKIAKMLKLSLEKAEELFQAYHRAIPFARTTMEACAQEIDYTGQVRTILGRVSDFPLWVPREYDKDAWALPYEEALREYGPDIHRAFKHKGINRKLQGGAADIMKTAMVNLWESGILDVVGVPGLTVHDELDWDDELEDENHPAWAEVQRIMEYAVPCAVPILVEGNHGRTWGDCK